MNVRNALLPLLALAGIALAVAVALRTARPQDQAVPAAMPAQAPFEAYIGGSGLVEAASNNISIGASVGGVVHEVHVEAGETVAAGQPLFQTDPREASAEIAVKAATLEKARASFAEAKASLKDYATQYGIVRGVTDRRAVSTDEVEKRRNAWELAKAKVESARADVAVAEAGLGAARTTLERLTVRAPIDGQVLQVNVRKGEYAATGSLSTPLLRLGGMARPRVRVDIDENDAWRFDKAGRAMAFVRGNRELKAELRFEYVEPYMVPKASLTGSSTERVDTRVLQVVYSFDAASLAAFAGQQLDVFVEIPQAPSAASAGGAGRGGS